MAKKNEQQAPKPAPKRVRHGYNLNVWIDPALGEALDAALADIVPRTSKTAVIEMLLGEWIKAKGKREGK